MSAAGPKSSRVRNSRSICATSSALAAALVPPLRNELVFKVLVAMQIPGIDIHEILQVHHRHVIEVMQRYTQVRAAAVSRVRDSSPAAVVSTSPGREDVHGRVVDAARATADVGHNREARHPARDVARVGLVTQRLKWATRMEIGIVASS